MKRLVLLFTLSLSLSAQASTLEYTCECQDTGMECDGGERLDVTLKKNKATIRYGEPDFADVAVFETRLNKNYRPQSAGNLAFKKFDIRSTTSKDYQIEKSNFLIEESLLQGESRGAVKFQSVQTEDIGGGFWSWVFECVPASP